MPFIPRLKSLGFSGKDIKTKVNKLFESLFNAVSSKTRDVSCFIGKVRYLTITELKKYSIALESTGAGVAETLLIKREAFAHENEVRLLYWEEREDPPAQIFQYKIDPLELIDEIVLDPRMTRTDYEKKENEIHQNGYLGTIIQSDLYKAPTGFLINIL